MSIIEQRYITETLGETLDTALRALLTAEQKAAEKAMISAIRKFVACKTQDTEYYTEQAAYYFGKIQQLMITHAVEFGVTLATEAPEFNADDKRIFNMMG